MNEFIELIFGTTELSYSPDFLIRLLILYLGIVCITSFIQAFIKGAR